MGLPVMLPVTGLSPLRLHEDYPRFLVHRSCAASTASVAWCETAEQMQCGAHPSHRMWLQVQVSRETKLYAGDMTDYAKHEE